MYHSQTQISRAGIGKGPSLWNQKPYRTKEQKRLARNTAYKADDGTYRSNAPRSFHPKPKGEK